MEQQGEVSMTYDQNKDVINALQATLPVRLHTDIPLLAQVLVAALNGTPSSVATEDLREALYQLQGKTLPLASGAITLGNVTGEGIAIGAGAQATVIRITVPASRAQQHAWRMRRQMLEKVRSFWISGVLNPSLRDVALVELGMQYYPDAIESAFDELVQVPDRQLDAVKPGTTISEVFTEFGQELLILGAPGTGKTTLLLELTRTLLTRALEDDACAMPVVFNLAAWAVKRRPLAEWLVEELSIRFDIPRKVAKTWIAEDLVLPLLDGLDEVRAPHIRACIEAINAFRQTHGLTGMGVCSRVADYQQQPRKLRLQGAVLLNLPTEQQIEHAIEQSDKDLTTVREALKRMQASARSYNNRDALDLLYTPLMLNIAVRAYQDAPSHELPAPSAAPEVHQQHLFTAYVERMFRRRSRDRRYTPEQTMHWLRWLATRMAEHGQATFFVERMQPSWMATRSLLRQYVWLDRLGMALLLGLVYAVCVRLLLNVSGFLTGWFGNEGLADALFYGLVGAVIAALVSSLFGGTDRVMTTSQAVWRRIVNALLGFTIVGTAVGVIFSIGTDFEEAFSSGIVYGTFGAAAAAINGPPSLAPRSIYVVEIMRWSWSQAWRAALSGVGFSLLLACTVAPLLGAMYAFFLGSAEGFWIGAGLGIVFMPIFAIFFSFGGGFSGEILDTDNSGQTNQGIWRSIRHAIVSSLAGGLISGVTVGFIIGRGVSVGVFFGSFLALVAGLSYGGYAVLAHLGLRLILYWNNLLPWNIARFLDFCVERVFLYKIGGGYIFIHRMVLEYFAGGQLVTLDEQLHTEAFDKTEPADRPQQHEVLPHSAWGIGSTVVGLLSFILASLVIGLAVYNVNNYDPTVATVGNSLIIVGGLINVVGLLSGALSVLQHNRRRTFVYIGSGLNLLVIVLMCGILTFALIYQRS
jgi:hypothetical protein